MHYANLETYLREAETTSSSVLPIPVVARWMNVTPPAVRAMLRRGVLEPVSIGSATFVSVLSLKQWHAALEAEVKKVIKLLQKAARKGRPISYGDLLAKLGRSFTKPADRRRLGPVLEAASKRGLLEYGVLLGVWAYSKTTDLPKYGVWDLADAHRLRKEGEGMHVLVAAQREASSGMFQKGG